MAVEWSVVGHWGLLVPAGEFNISNAPELTGAFAELAGAGVSDVVLDLSRVVFLDGAAIGAIVAAAGELAGIGGRMAVVGASDAAFRAFGIVGLGDALPVFRADAHAPAPHRTHLPGPDDAALGALLFSLGEQLLTGTSLSADLARVVELATEAVPGCSSASVSLIVEGVPRSAVVTDRVAVEVDVAQYSLGEGPCLAAATTAERVRIDMLEQDERFQHFAPRAMEAGVNSTLSASITLDQLVVGSINLYGVQARAFDQSAESLIEVLATQASLAIAKSSLWASVRSFTEAVQQQVDAEADVRLAAGVLVGLQGHSVAQAERLLHAAADLREEAVVEAAQRIISHVRGKPGA